MWKGLWKSRNMTVAVKKVIDLPEAEVSLWIWYHILAHSTLRLLLFVGTNFSELGIEQVIYYLPPYTIGCASVEDVHYWKWA